MNVYAFENLKNEIAFILRRNVKLRAGQGNKKEKENRKLFTSLNISKRVFYAEPRKLFSVLPKFSHLFLFSNNGL